MDAIVETLARHGLALRAGSESLRRWVAENEARAAATAGYGLAVLVMLVLVVTAATGGGDAPSASARPASAPDYYTLREGDTLAGVAARFGLNVEEVRKLNPRIDPLALPPGSKVRLRSSARPVAAPTKRAHAPAPDAAARPGTRPRREAPAAKPPPPPSPPPAPPRQAREIHVVDTGDTLSSIAAANGTTVDALLALNPRVDPLMLNRGQQIRVR